MPELLSQTVRHAFWRNRFLVLGRAGLDLYADPPGTEVEDAAQFTAALGGSAGNIAAGISRLGGTAAMLGAISDDAVGRYTINQLRAYGVDHAHMHAVRGEARNSLAVVETRAENCQSVIYRNNAADFQLSADHVRGVDFTNWGVLIVTGTALAMEPSRSATLLAMTLARETGCAVAIDLDYRPYSWTSQQEASRVLQEAVALCDMIVGNDVEFDVLSQADGRRFAATLARTHDCPVIYKMGEKGCVTFAGDAQVETPIFRVEALKPTGAGDAFFAGLATGLAQGQDLSSSVERGAAAAAIVVTRVGCAPAMPTPDELNRFLMDRKTKR
jgi:5-dehydro-2-deoxygluconokinase